jgi:hypothetical protein
MPILTLNDIIKPSILNLCTSFKDIDSRNFHVINIHFFTIHGNIVLLTSKQLSYCVDLQLICCDEKVDTKLGLVRATPF